MHGYIRITFYDQQSVDTCCYIALLAVINFRRRQLFELPTLPNEAENAVMKKTNFTDVSFTYFSKFVCI